MDANKSGYLLHSFYYETREEEGIIDLGLSLKTSQPEVHHPSGGQLLGLEGYDELVDWSARASPLLSSHVNASHQKELRYRQDCNEEVGGEERKERWAYVKVNMDGVIIGRKICMLNHHGFSSLALQLEEMFGKQSPSGLRLFQPGSDFCLYYKDNEDYWRHVWDVSWKEFAECVKRLRIARRCNFLNHFRCPLLDFH